MTCCSHSLASAEQIKGDTWRGDVKRPEGQPLGAPSLKSPPKKCQEHPHATQMGFSTTCPISFWPCVLALRLECLKAFFGNMPLSIRQPPSRGRLSQNWGGPGDNVEIKGGRAVGNVVRAELEHPRLRESLERRGHRVILGVWYPSRRHLATLLGGCGPCGTCLKGVSQIAQHSVSPGREGPLGWGCWLGVCGQARAC